MRTPSVDRIATCGWLITGTVINVPKPPALVMVKVPPEMSSIVSRLERAREASPDISRASATSRFSSARWMTGTSRPSKSRSTAMPRLTSPCTISSSSPTEELRYGHSSERVDHRPGDEGQVGQAETLGGLEMLPLGQTRTLDGGVVDLDRHHRVGRRVLGTDHVLGRAPPDVGERHDRVALAGYRYRAGRDDARPRCRPSPRRPPRTAAGRPCSSGRAVVFRPSLASVRRAPGAVGALAVDRRQHVVAGDPAASTGAGYLGRVEAVLGDQPADDGRQELARAALSRRAGGTLVGGRDPGLGGPPTGGLAGAGALWLAGRRPPPAALPGVAVHGRCPADPALARTA